MIDRAIQVAIAAHEGQTRKGSGVPYITHPFAVGLILARAGAEDEVIAAGILHDTVEDTPLELVEIEKQFGSRVARLVEGASEPDKSLPWQARKQHTIDYLRSAPMDVRIVTCADKLHNVRTMRRDLETIGHQLWERFNKGRAEQAWYYESVVESLGEQEEFDLLVELRKEVDSLFHGQE